MATRRKTKAGRKPADAGARTRKNFRLPQEKLDAARAILGTKTETETVERALDLVAFGERLARGTERARGREWRSVFAEFPPEGRGDE